jgi:signal transduction histidine kinase
MKGVLVKTFSLPVLFFISFCFGQQDDFSFSNIYDQSVELKKDALLHRDTNNKKKSIVLKLVAKEYWEVSDLKVVDSLLKLDIPSESNLKGLYNYIGALAYYNFDSDLQSKYLQEAYIAFEANDDVEGMFFSLLEIFNSKISIATRDVNAEGLDKPFEELKILAARSDYIPVQLALTESFMRKSLKLNDDINDDVLSSIVSLAEAHEEKYSSLSRKLFTAIGITHQRKGNFDKDLYFEEKAQALADPQDYDYPSYLVNIGGSYFYKRDFDSAKYFLRKAYFKMLQNPETIYQASIKSTTAYNLSIAYNMLKDVDSAYYFSIESYKHNSALMNLKLKQSNLYAEKKFEVQKAELKVANKERELIEERETKAFLIVGFLVSLILIFFFLTLIFFLIYIYRRTIKLKDEANQLKDKREQLLSIVSHDLGESLQVFSDSVIIIPKLIEQKRFDDLKQIQYSMSDTINSFQTILSNLFSWSKKTSPQDIEEHTTVNINEQLNLILKSYEDVAGIKNLNINFQHNGEVIFKSSAFKLNNLFRNIIYNAIKHSSPDDTINIKVETDSNHNLQFECQNTIKPHSTESVEELIYHFNGVKPLEYSNKGLGLELIDDAIKELNAAVKASLHKNVLEINISIPRL